MKDTKGGLNTCPFLLYYLCVIKQINSIDDLTPDPDNINKGTERGYFMLDKSLDMGAGRSVLASSDGVLIAGNKTVEQWELKSGAIQVVQSDGTKLIVVQRTDIDSHDPRFRRMAIADNRVSEINYDADMEKLKKAALEIKLSDFYSEDELAAIMDEADIAGDIGPVRFSFTVECENAEHLGRVEAAVKALGAKVH